MEGYRAQRVQLPQMLEAFLYGGVGGVALVLGAVLALVLPYSSRMTSLVMAFGAGVLISVLSHDLTIEAYQRGGADVLVLGAMLGALTFFGANVLIARLGGGARKRSDGTEHEAGSSTAIVLGTVLDGIPESVVIGISLLGGDGIPAAVVAAVFLSNIPESLSATTGMRRGGRSVLHVLVLWSAITLVSALAAAIGYGVLGGAGRGTIGVIEAYAAGAILMMVADTMMPEAVEFGGNRAGLVTVAGFLGAFVLSQQ